MVPPEIRFFPQKVRKSGDFCSLRLRAMATQSQTRLLLGFRFHSFTPMQPTMTSSSQTAQTSAERPSTTAMSSACGSRISSRETSSIPLLSTSGQVLRRLLVRLVTTTRERPQLNWPPMPTSTWRQALSGVFETTWMQTCFRLSRVVAAATLRCSLPQVPILSGRMLSRTTSTTVVHSIPALLVRPSTLV